MPYQVSYSFMLLYLQCSFGFIYEREQLEATCPQCHQTFCVRCKRQVRHNDPFRKNLLSYWHILHQTQDISKHGTDMSSGLKEPAD